MSRTVWLDDAAHEDTGQRTIWLLSGGALEDTGGGSASEGAVAATLDALTSAATGVLPLVGLLEPVTLAPATLSAAGTSGIFGSLAQTFAALNLSAFGGEKYASLSATFDALSLAANGGKAAGIVTATLGALTTSATGAIAKTGSFSRTLRSLSLASASSLAIRGSLASTLGE